MSDNKTNVEDSIKIALDAADTATSAASELDSIRSENQKVRAEMKKVYRNMVLLMLSAFAGAAGSIFLASLMYYNALSEMKTANNTSLEALVIFAENVDKLAAATATVENLGTKIDGLKEDTKTILEQNTNAEEMRSAAHMALKENLGRLQKSVSGSLSQYSTAIIDSVSKTLVEEDSTLNQRLASIDQSTSNILSQLNSTTSTNASTANLSKPQVEEIISSLQQILLSQEEIKKHFSPKVKSSSRTSRTAPKKAPTAGMVKYP